MQHAQLEMGPVILGVPSGCFAVQFHAGLFGLSGQGHLNHTGRGPLILGRAFGKGFEVVHDALIRRSAENFDPTGTHGGEPIVDHALVISGEFFGRFLFGFLAFGGQEGRFDFGSIGGA